MTEYLVTASACDDITTIAVDLDDDEAAVVARVAERITATSTYNCMPTLAIQKRVDVDDSDGAAFAEPEGARP